MRDDWQTGNHPQDVQQPRVSLRGQDDQGQEPYTSERGAVSTPLDRLLWLVNKVANAAIFVFVAILMGGIGWIFGDVFFGPAVGIVVGLVAGIGSGWAIVRITDRLMFEAMLWLFGPAPEEKAMLREQRKMGRL